MDVYEPLREAQNLRFRFQMNRRLRLECLAAVSKVFREQGEPISDEMLSTVVFALPQELVSGNGRTAPALQMADDKDQSQVKQPGNPPEKPRPGNPPYPPKPENPPEPPKPENPPEPPKPGNPPAPPKPENPPEPPKPGVPPEQPAPYQPSVPPEEPVTQPLQAPGVPPQAPDQSALSY